MKINIQNRIFHRVFPVVTAFIIFAMSVFCYSSPVSASSIDNSASDTAAQNVTTLAYSFWKLNTQINPLDPIADLTASFSLPYVNAEKYYSKFKFSSSSLKYDKLEAYSFTNNIWSDDKYRYVYIVSDPMQDSSLLDWLKANAVLITQSKTVEKPTVIDDVFNTTWTFNSTLVKKPVNVTVGHVTDYRSDGPYNHIYINSSYRYIIIGNGPSGELYHSDNGFRVKWIRFIEHCTDADLFAWLSANATLTGWDVDPPEIPAYVPAEQGGVQPVQPTEPSQPTEPVETSPVDPTVPIVTDPVSPEHPDSALDYSDFITDIKTVDGISYVTFEIPMEYLMYQVTVDDEILDFGQGNTVTYESKTSGLQEVKYYFDNRGRLDASCIPSSTTFTTNILTSNSPGSNTPTLRFAVRSWSDGSNYKEIAFTSETASLSSLQSLTVENVNIPPNSKFVDFSFDYDGWQALDDGSGITSVQRTVTVDSLSMTMTVDSLFMQQQQSQKQNALLEAVDKKLAENGKKLDDVLSGDNLNDHNVNAPGGFNDKVNQQQSQMQNNMADINKVEKPDPNTAIPDVGSYVPAEGTNLLAIVMGGITGFSMVPTYLMIVVGLFVVSFIMFGKKEQ